MTRVWDVPVHDSTRVRDARVAARGAAALAGLDEPRTAAAALVATELATNLLKHAGGGQLLVEAVAPPAGHPGALVVQIAALDHGPGLADGPAALMDGFSTAGSLGAGLGTCRRLADDFGLYGTPGRGTVALARIGREATSGSTGPRGAPGTPGAAVARAGGINVPYAGAEYSGDAWTWVRADDRLTLMLADGLGHGPEASRASTAAVDELRRVAHLPPAEILRRLDGALRATRGAAVAVAQLDVRAGRLRFAGPDCARGTAGGRCSRTPASSARTGRRPCRRPRCRGERTGCWSCTATGCRAAGCPRPTRACSPPTPPSRRP